MANARFRGQGKTITLSSPGRVPGDASETAYACQEVFPPRSGRRLIRGASDAAVLCLAYKYEYLPIAERREIHKP